MADALRIATGSHVVMNFIDSELALQLFLNLDPLPHALRVTALSGQCLPDITHVSKTWHTVRDLFFVFRATQTPLVLGHPWLQQHNPHINWQKGCITGWAEECHMTCLKTTSTSSWVASPSEPPASSDLANVPSVYHDLAEGFRKDLAQSLPLHHPYDCAIDLLPGAPLPTSRLYSLSLPEREAMEKYIYKSQITHTN